MTSIDEFLHMGGYASYVWSAYGITAVVLIANVLTPLQGRRATLRRLARQHRLERRKS